VLKLFFNLSSWIYRLYFIPFLIYSAVETTEMQIKTAKSTRRWHIRTAALIMLTDHRVTGRCPKCVPQLLHHPLRLLFAVRLDPTDSTSGSELAADRHGLPCSRLNYWLLRNRSQRRRNTIGRYTHRVLTLFSYLWIMIIISIILGFTNHRYNY